MIYTVNMYGMERIRMYFIFPKSCS